MIKNSRRISGIEQYYFAQKLAQIKEMDLNGSKVINLGIGSPDLLPNEAVTQVLQEAALLPDANKYQSYRGVDGLRSAFSNWYLDNFGVVLDMDCEILPLLGSKEGIMHVSMAFLDEGDEVLVPNPGYPAYETCAKIAGATPIRFDLETTLDWKPDLDKLKDRDLSKVKIMWINYPNMPTGATVDLAFINEIALFGRDNEILICHDNPYSFILNDNPLSFLQAKDAFPWMLELTSLSKNYNMAGWRVGAVSAHRDIISSILTFKSNMDSGMFKPLQSAAITALQSPAKWLAINNEVYRARKKIVFEIFELLNCKVEASNAGMFVWAKVPSALSAKELSDVILEDARVFMTPGFIFGSNGVDYLRISLCSTESDFCEAIERIKSINF